MRYREVVESRANSDVRSSPAEAGGSHRKWHNPATEGFAPLPDWGNNDLKLGTVRGVVRLLGLDREEFKQA